jgi:peptide/nickel transport system substrate-binding protein
VSRRRFWISLPLAACLSLLAACASSASGGEGAGYNAAANAVINASSGSGGTLRAVFSADFDSIDPGNTYEATAWDFINLYGRPMLNYAPTTGTPKLVPDLATGLGQESTDGLTWTYHIRQGVKFQNGQEVTAADVKYAIERSNWGHAVLSTGPSYFSSLIQDTTAYKGPYVDKSPADSVSGIQTPDNYTIVFHLTKRFADFNYLMTLPQTVPVPRSADTGATYFQHVESIGPFIVQSYQVGKEMTLTRNSEFDESTDPYHLHSSTLDKVTVQLNVNATTVDQELLSGQADIDITGTGMQLAGRNQVLASPTLKSNADVAYNNALGYMAMNTQIQPFDNVHCRRAVEYAINKVDEQNEYGGAVGGGAIATNLLVPAVAGYQKFDMYVTPNDQGDVTKAKAELAQCQAAEPGKFSNNGFSTTVSAYTNTPGQDAAAVAVQQALAGIGITVTIDQFPFSQYYGSFAGNESYAQQHDIGLSFGEWSPDFATVYGMLYSIGSSAGISSGGGAVNLSYFDDPAIDSLFAQAEQQSTSAGAAKYAPQIDQQLMSDALMVPLIQHSVLLYRSPRLTNVVITQAYGMYDYGILGLK